MQIGVFDVNNNLKKIPNYDIYWVSPKGEIYTYLRGFFEKFKYQKNTRNGYVYVNLYDRKLKTHKSFRFHRIVADLFVANPHNYPVVNHIDGDKTNNAAKNLEWTTVSENTKHAFDMKLAKNDKGVNDSQSMPLNVIFDENNIRYFGSACEAMRETNIDKSTFLRLARNHKTSKRYGFKVKFA